MKNKTTFIPIKERLYYEFHDNGDLILNREKSSYFLVVATENDVLVEYSLYLNSSKGLQFLKTLSSESKDFVYSGLKKLTEDI